PNSTISIESCLGSSSGSANRRRNLLSRSNFRSYIFLKHNKQPLVDVRTSQHVIEQVRQLECDSHLASVAKVLPSRDGLLKILNSNRDIKIGKANGIFVMMKLTYLHASIQSKWTRMCI
ncbi:unnamed protein product, partial [Musa acuminata subsp. burmannicoides]